MATPLPATPGQHQRLDLDDDDVESCALGAKLQVADASLLALLGGRATIHEGALLPLLKASGALVACSATPVKECAAGGEGADARQRWDAAAGAALALSRDLETYDPWAARDIPRRCHTELALRHDYDAETKAWTQREMLVKIESEPFAEGAMRECFRMKKLSQQPGSTQWLTMDWDHASNYVAKQYKAEGVGREAYAADVVLQMEAKLWASRFNRLGPPKKVDFLQGSYFELPNRAALGQPALFAVERLVQGPYIKHNNNSGFVDESHRVTPQLFSHFTFQASQGELIVVDIQGVDDLYTDPQIHSRSGKYGEGNLGVRGMAHFFATYVPSPLAQRLGLPAFPMLPAVRARLTVSFSPNSTLGAATAVGTVASRPTVHVSEAAAVGAERQPGEAFVASMSDLTPLMATQLDDAHETMQGTHSVHFELATLHAAGMAACDDSLPDARAALFHLCCAARGAAKGDLRACAALRSLIDGSEWPQCPELSLACDDDPEAARALSGRLLRLMAERGDRDAALELAMVANTPAEEVRWLSLVASAELDSDEDREAAAYGNAQYQVLERLALALLSAGEPGDAARAAEVALEAAAGAMALGRAKASLKLEALAEEAQSVADAEAETTL